METFKYRDGSVKTRDNGYRYESLDDILADAGPGDWFIAGLVIGFVSATLIFI